MLLRVRMRDMRDMRVQLKVHCKMYRQTRLVGV